MPISENSTRKTIKVDGLQINYHDAGDGAVILFIHGSGPGATGWSNFARNLDYFARSYRVLALDLPNFGLSSKGEVPSTAVYSYYARVVLGFLDALGIPSASLVGNSLGGGISLKAAIDAPERYDKLVIMGGGGGIPVLTPTPSEVIKLAMDYWEDPGPTKEKLGDFLRGMVYDSSDITEELIEERFASSTQAGIVPLFTRSRPPGQELLISRLHEIKQKTLLIWGRDDRAVMLDNAFVLLKLIPDVRLHVFGKCGHWVQWEKPDEFNILVDSFLK